MQSVSYVELGATLFVPASHTSLGDILSGVKYVALKSVVVDFEDGLDAESLENATKNFELLLREKKASKLLVFVRARDSKHLKKLLKLENIESLTGFILAKFSLKNAQEYLSLLEKTEHLIMPSIETEELFSHEKLHQLKELLVANKHKIVLVRFGLEDMLKALGMRRSCEVSLFDLSAPSAVIGNFIATFKSAGFAISGGVYPCFKDDAGFIKDVKRDLQEGLFTKTIIHPRQIQLLQKSYRVTQKEYDEACEIVNAQKVVFSQNEKMAETLTMKRYSEEILLRARVYGVL